MIKWVEVLDREVLTQCSAGAELIIAAREETTKADTD